MESKEPGEARGRREEGAIGTLLVQPTRSGTGYDRDIIDTRITDYQDH